MFEAGKTYRLDTRDTQTFMLVGPEQRNGANKAVKIDIGFGTPTAACYSTNHLTASQWVEVAEAGVPPRLMAKIRAKANQQGFPTG